MTLRDELEPFASTGREAARIVDTFFDAAVASLRRDHRFTKICLREFDLLLADARRDAERQLFNELRDKVHLDDVDVVMESSDE